MDRLLECSVCLDLYDSSSHKPMMLPCGHTICLACVRVTMSREHLCPVCRKPTGSDVEALQVNYALIYDRKPTVGATAGPGLDAQQRDDLKRTISQLLTSLEDEKSGLSQLQSRWKSIRHDQNSLRLSLLNTFTSAIDSLQQAVSRINAEFSALDETCQREVEEEAKAIENDVQAKLEAVGELSRMLAGNAQFLPQRVVEVETQLARPYVPKVVSGRVAAIPGDIAARTSAMITELTSGAISYSIVAINPKPECQMASLPQSSMASIQSVPDPGKKGVKRRNPKDEPVAEKPDRQRREKPDRKEPVIPAAPGLIPQPGGPSEGARWGWLKNNNSIKDFDAEMSQELEKAFQSGIKQYNLMNPKTGALAFLVDFERFESFKNGKGKPRRISRMVEG